MVLYDRGANEIFTCSVKLMLKALFFMCPPCLRKSMLSSYNVMSVLWVWKRFDIYIDQLWETMSLDTQRTRKRLPSKANDKAFFCVSAPCSRRFTSLFKLQTRVPPRPSAYWKHTLLFPHWVSITSEQTVIRPLMRVLSLAPRPNWISQRPLKKLLAAWQPATLKVWVNVAGVEVFSKFRGDYKSSLESLNISCTSPVAVVQQKHFGRKGFARSRTNSFVSSFRPCRHSCSLIHRLIFLKPSRSESSEPAEGFRKVFQCRHGADLTRFSQSINSVQGRSNAYFNLWCGSLKLYSPIVPMLVCIWALACVVQEGHMMPTGPLSTHGFTQTFVTFHGFREYSICRVRWGHCSPC